MAKFLINDKKAINLANISEFSVSANYLKLTTDGGLGGRIISFVYGTEENLNRLFDAIVAFASDDSASTFDCGEFMKTL